MGLLDGVIGGLVGGEMINILSSVIEKNGGVQGLVTQFEQQGMGPTIKTWVSQGENAAITPDEIHKVMGTQTVQNLAQKLGMTPDELASKLSVLLPQTVDKMTPDGKVAA